MPDALPEVGDDIVPGVEIGNASLRSTIRLRSVSVVLVTVRDLVFAVPQTAVNRHMLISRGFRIIVMG